MINRFSGSGIAIGAEAANGRINGNYIGTDPTGSTTLSNQGHGILIDGGSNFIVGGLEPGAGNLIAGNVQAGVQVRFGAGNRMIGNRIFANGSLGIDLGQDGPDANDGGDWDEGPNTRLNAPVLYGAASSAGGMVITGLFNSAANQNYTVSFYANSQCDASGFGEGERYLGATSASTNESGNGSFGVTLPVAAANGQFVTALLTDAAGNTSEFSACMIAQPNNTAWNNALPLTLAGSPETVTGSAAQYLDRTGQSLLVQVSQSSQAARSLSI